MVYNCGIRETHGPAVRHTSTQRNVIAEATEAPGQDMLSRPLSSMECGELPLGKNFINTMWLNRQHSTLQEYLSGVRIQGCSLQWCLYYQELETSYSSIGK